jgi:hypothetical protein
MRDKSILVTLQRDFSDACDYVTCSIFKERLLLITTRYKYSLSASELQADFYTKTMLQNNMQIDA